MKNILKNHKIACVTLTLLTAMSSNSMLSTSVIDGCNDFLFFTSHPTIGQRTQTKLTQTQKLKFNIHHTLINAQTTGRLFPAPTVEQRIMPKISESGWCLAALSPRARQTRMPALSGPRQLEPPLQQVGPNEESGAWEWRRAGRQPARHRSPAWWGHRWGAD